MDFIKETIALYKIERATIKSNELYENGDLEGSIDVSFRLVQKLINSSISRRNTICLRIEEILLSSFHSYFKLNKLDKMEECGNLLISFYPEQENIKRSEICKKMGENYETKEKFHKSLKYYTEYLRFSSENFNFVYMKMLTFCFKMNQCSLAEDFILSYDNIDFRNELLLVYYLKKIELTNNSEEVKNEIINCKFNFFLNTNKHNALLKIINLNFIKLEVS